MSIQREPPIAELSGAAVRTVRIGRRDRRPAALAAVLVAFVGLAVAKPWQTPASTGPELPTAAAASPGAPGAGAATLEPADLAALRHDCQDPNGWRVYSHEVWNGSPVRVWRRLEPDSAASGPLDPGLPVVEIGPIVSAVGYCSPWSGVGRPPDGASIAAWRVTGSDAGARADPVDLVAVAPRVRTVLGALFGPTAARGGGPGDGSTAAPGSETAAPPIPTTGGAASPGSGPAGPAGVDWPTGRWVFAVRTTAWARWWEVDILPDDPFAAGSRTGPSGPGPRPLG